MSVVKIRKFRGMSKVTKDKIWNNNIRSSISVAPILDKLRENVGVGKVASP